MSENTKLIEAIIFCDMIRVSQKGAVPLLDRLNLSEYTNQFRYLNHSQQSIRDILSLKESNYQKFEILVCDDACPKCRKMRNKKFKVSEAKLGVNLPPFCDNCRCTILPVIGSRCYFIKVKNIIPLENMNLLVLFENGIIKKFDVKPIIKDFPEYSQLENQDIFNLVSVEPGGYGVSWNDELDCSEGELWENGVDTHLTINDLISAANL